MTDKKFTDEEIIKAALEAEIHIAEYVDSDYCSNIEVSLLKSTLDLINSQKEEIERLKSQCENTQIGYNFLKSDFERLKGSTIVNNIMEIQRIKRDVKAEAYKAFATKIYQAFAVENTRDGCLDCTLNYTRLMECVDNVLKELVADNKGCQYCKGRAYTKKPLTVITRYGRRIELTFDYCPKCGRRLKPVDENLLKERD